MSEPKSEGERQRYGPYEIVKPIGKGKFAVVYRAKRVSDDEVVALKRINVDSVDDKARDKCLKEVGFLQSLDHPNIVKYMDSFINENDLVIVFEWAAAGDLKRQLRKAQERGVGFEERIIWKYFSQICDAMQHMHERRIMHRDLKPANIFLTLDGTVKVGDLGLSREMSENTIQAHSKVGTPLYMSPEVLKGDGYDFKSDIWSLGCILYELAMLKSPFKAEGLNLYSLFQKISKGDYQPLPEQYSDELKDLAYKMISTAPEDRPEIERACVVAREMRAIYSDKAQAAKRQAQQQAKQQQAELERAARDQAVAQQGAETKDGNGPRHARSSEEKDFKDDLGSRTGSAAAASADAKEPGSASHGVTGSSPHAVNAGTYAPSGVESTEPARTWEKARETETAQDVDDWARGGTKNKSSAYNNVSRDYEGGRNRPDDGAKDEGRSWASGASLSKRDEGRGKETTVAPTPQYGANDTTCDVPVGFEREEPNKRQISAPTVTRRIKNSPSPKKATAPDRRANREPTSSETAGGGAGGKLDFDRDDGETPLPRVTSRHDSRNAEVMASIKDSYVAFALSETLYRKLVVLGCPLDDSGERGGLGSPGVARNRKPNGQGRLLPMHFAVDLSSLGSVAGHTKGRSEQHFQFQRFSHVCLWLLDNIGGRAAQLAASVDLESSTPMMIAKQLLMAAGEAGCAEETLSEVTPTNLIAGFGERVCAFLLALVDSCTLAINNGLLPLRYEKEDAEADDSNVDGINDDDDEEGEEEVEEEVMNLSVGAASPGRMSWGGDEATERGRDDAVFGSNQDEDSPLRHMIVAGVDEAAWREETERVAPALAKARLARAGGFGGGEWGDHLQALQAFAKQFEADASTARDAPAKPSFSSVTSTVQVLHKSLKAQLEQLDKAESMLNVKEQLSRLSNAYGNFKSEAVSLESSIATKSSNVQQLSDTLATVDERLGEVLESMEDKHGQGGMGGDTSQATKIRAAIKRIKEETADMSVALGITENMVLAKRQQSAHSKRTQHKAKAASRAKHVKRGHRRRDDD